MVTSRNAVLQYIKETYDVLPDYPWARTPNSAILRQRHNRKWFALITDVTRDKLGFDSGEIVDILNVKCTPILVAEMQRQPGILPAYHMNKEHWLTILLDGTAEVETVRSLLAVSFQLTK